MPMRNMLSVVLLLVVPAVVLAQPAAIRLIEKADGPAYRVDIKTTLTGKLTIPGTEPGKGGEIVPLVGASRLVYDERPLPADESKSARVIRVYRTVDVSRTVGDVDQKAAIRDAVRRMVVLRSEKGKKAPFSPDGPLTLNEIDVIRNDVFSPLLAGGLLPANEVKPGDQWKASVAAVADLTDLDTLDESGLTVEFVSVVMIGKRKNAKLTIAGTVSGQNDDGPTRQKLDGIAYFDLEAERLSYLKLSGTHELISKDGKVAGRLEGTFTMTRQPSPQAEELTAQSLRGLELSPTPDNSQILYENPELGVKLVYPRRWRLGVVRGRQIALEEPTGGSILLTVEPLTRLPTGEQFLREVRASLAKEKKPTTLTDGPKRVEGLAAKVERFGFDLGTGKVEGRLEYAVVATAEGGVLLAAKLPVGDQPLHDDIRRVLKGLTLTKKIEGK